MKEASNISLFLVLALFAILVVSLIESEQEVHRLNSHIQLLTIPCGSQSSVINVCSSFVEYGLDNY